MKYSIGFIFEKLLLTAIVLTAVWALGMMVFIMIMIPHPSQSIKTEQVNQFIKQLKTSDKSIGKVDIHTMPTYVMFEYTYKKAPDKDEMNKVFQLSYDLLTKDDKLKDLTINKENHVSIFFRYKEDVYRYDAEKYTYDNETRQKVLDNYKTWKISNTNNEIVETIISKVSK